MADSVGNAFPRGINVGHVHVNNVDGFVYRYLGDVPTNSLNWVIIGGAADADPSTVGWTTRQDGAQWFNKTLNAIRVWDGAQVVSIGVGSGGSVQRWPYLLTGTGMSVGFGISAQMVFIVPAAGTITKWAIISGSAGLGESLTIRLYYDPFVTFALIDGLTLTVPSSNVKFERTVSQAVVAGDTLLVFNNNTLNPAQHSAMISGYVDFTPD